MSSQRVLKHVQKRPCIATLFSLITLTAFVSCVLIAADTAFSQNAHLLENSWRYDNGQIKENIVEAQFDGSSTDGSAESVQADEAEALEEYESEALDDGALDASAISAASATELDSSINLLSASVSTLSTSDSSMTHLGIDVSEHNGDINWTKVAKTKVKYAIIRCGYGSDYSDQDDKKWLANVAGAQKANIPFGVYIYSYAMNEDDARSEAAHVLRCLEAAGLSPSTVQFPIYYDIENSSDSYNQKSLSATKLCNIFYAFRDTLKASGYSKVGLYASASWWVEKFSNISLSADYRWVARYGVNDGTAHDFYYTGFESLKSKGCGIWQYASVGSVSGISGNVDMNYARNDLRFLDQSGDEVNMYRLYNKWTGEHLYTYSASECGTLEGLGWKYEGIGWRAPTSSSTPVYRLYNKYIPGGEHHYTTSKSEYNYLRSIGWTGEGVGWYSASEDETPLYRLFNKYASSGTHHYTASASEKDALVKLGWKYEGLAWYGLS